MRVRRTLAALLAASFCMSACGGSSSVADPPVSSHTTSSAPTTQPPAHETPEHFIRRFYEAEREMENSGRTAAYSSLISNCRPCDGLINQVRSFYSAGGFIKWGGLTIDSIKVFSYNTQQGPSFSVEFTARPTHYRTSSTASLKTLPGGQSTDVLTLHKTSDSWEVAARARLSS